MNVKALLVLAGFNIVNAALLYTSLTYALLWPCALLAMAGFFLSIREANSQQTMLAAVLLFFPFMGMVTGPWWWPTLERFADPPGYVILFSWLGVTLIQTLPYVLWAGLSKKLSESVSPFIIWPMFFIAIETFFPFPLKSFLAITIMPALPLLQIAEITGPAGPFAFIILFGLVIATSLEARAKGEVLQSLPKLIAVLTGIMVCCSLRLWHVNIQSNEAQHIEVGIVQPNVAPMSPSDRERYGADMLNNLRKASRDAFDANTRLIVWPESAWPYLLDRKIQHDFPDGHPWQLRKGLSASLFFGTLSHTFGEQDVYNSAVLINQNNQITGRHDKIRLVPFAEKIPFEETFPQWAADIRQDLEDKPDITAGAFKKVIEDEEIRILPMICSEALDQELTTQLMRDDPNLLINISSDAWFGVSAAPRYHLALARFRAIETRRALIRAANTGISAVIHPSGKRIDCLSLNSGLRGADIKTSQPQTLKATVPLSDISTIPYLLPYLSALFCLVFPLAIWLRHSRKTN